MTLHEQLVLKKGEARKAFEAGDLETGRSLKEEAVNLAAAIEEINAVDSIRADMPEPVRPPFPGMGLGNQPDPTPDVPAAESGVRAAYVRRFGEPEGFVKSALTELHGAGYAQAFYDQKKAFVKYLRTGELDREERAALSHIIYTPAAIKAAMDQGIYDVSTLRATMIEGSDVLGGYVVPVDFQARVISRLPGFTVVRPRATVLTTSRDKVSIPTATGGDDQYTSAVRVTWVDETPTATQAESNLTFGLENIQIHTAMITTPMSQNLLEDAFFNIESFLAEKFAEAAGVDEDNKFLIGGGGASPRGILPNSLNAHSLTEEDSADANLLTWDGGAAGAATKRGLLGITYALAAQYMPNAAWYMERATAEVIRSYKDGSGRYLWEPNQQVGEPPMLLGYPVFMQEGLPSIAANAYPIIFGDMKGYYIADRVGMSVNRFNDSATASTNTVKYVMRRRLGGEVCETYRLAVLKIAA
jgi:HK97 family phage major capsid protein